MSEQLLRADCPHCGGAITLGVRALIGAESAQPRKITSVLIDQETARQQIVDARLAAGLSQNELARLMGSTQPAVARVERGSKPVTASWLHRTMTAIGSESPEVRAKREAEKAAKALVSRDQARAALRAARTEAGLSQRRLGALLGLSGKAVATVEAGASGISEERLARWMEVIRAHAEKHRRAGDAPAESVDREGSRGACGRDAAGALPGADADPRGAGDHALVPGAGSWVRAQEHGRGLLPLPGSARAGADGARARHPGDDDRERIRAPREGARAPGPPPVGSARRVAAAAATRAHVAGAAPAGRLGLDRGPRMPSLAMGVAARCLAGDRARPAEQPPGARGGDLEVWICSRLPGSPKITAAACVKNKAIPRDVCPGCPGVEKLPENRGGPSYISRAEVAQRSIAAQRYKASHPAFTPGHGG